ncbi:hypothetical protein CKO24_09390 [Rhodothalassium salexigens DSM 2132]|nr:hypothetical protein [Rhodothalassium salexigens DSM 2132]
MRAPRRTGRDETSQGGMVKLPGVLAKLIPSKAGKAAAADAAGDPESGGAAAAAMEAEKAAALAGAAGYARAPLTASGKLPLTWQLRAWWDGFDPNQIAEILGRYSPAVDEAGLDDVMAAAAPPPDEPEMEAPKPVDPDDWQLPFDPWDPYRLEVAHYIWGEGFCGPGGPSYVVNTSKLLALKPEMSVMEFGSGLGAGARALVEGFGCWITGFEQSGRLAELANHKATMMGMAKKAKIDLFDPADPNGFGRNYDRVIARQVLHQYKNKDKIVQLINKHMKPTGLVLATDFVLANEDARRDPEVKEWLRHEPFTPFLATSKEFSGLFSNCDFVVRVDEDVTLEYIQLINRNWRGADELVERLKMQPDGPDLITVLMRHGELWQRRASLMKAGKLRLWRLMGTKVGGKPEAMSDW